LRRKRVKSEDFARDMERLLLYEEVNCRKKFKAHWLREGDKIQRERNNTMDLIIMNGSLSSDPT
jgi:hypothetical protein